MKNITSHQVQFANDHNSLVAVQANDEPSHGGARHHYTISPYNEELKRPINVVEIRFQHGPVKEHGVNGISNEALLAIVKDRLEDFQAGPYASPDNREALFHVAHAMRYLHNRTYKRMERDVEGTSAA